MEKPSIRRLWRAGIPGLLLIGVLVLALGLSVQGLHRALSERVPLRSILGVRWWLCTAALVLSVALTLIALFRVAWKIRNRTPAAAPFAWVRKLVCIAVLGWLVFLACAQPFQRIHFDLALGITAGAFSVLIAAEPGLNRLPLGARRAADIVAFNLCLSALVAELSLRALSEWKPSALLARVASTPTQVLERNRCQPGELRFGFPCNARGHFDGEFRPKAPGERLVITIGDSFSIGVVPHPLHFTTVCERELGIPIYNMGVAGTNPPEYLALLMNEALPLDPDAVVIDVFVGNDILYPAVPRASADAGLRAWFDSANVLLCSVPGRMLRLSREQRARTKQQGVVGSVQGEHARAGDGRVHDLAARFPWVVDPSLETPTLSEESFQGIEAQRALEVCTDSPSNYRRALEALADIHAAAGDTPLYALLIPDEFQVEESVWRSVKALVPDADLERDRPQRILSAWFERNGIPCLDLLPILRQAPLLSDGRRHLYHLRDTHFNARGNRIAGEALASFLRQHLSASSAREPIPNVPPPPSKDER